MIFAELPLDEAVGALVAHTLRAGGRVLKKGCALTADDVAVLAHAGHARVLVARLEPGDVGEDAAAAEIAKAIAGEGMVVAAPFTGRANLYAALSGLAIIDAATIDAINLVDEAITVATLPPFTRVEARQILATVKIIPYAVPGRGVAACRAAAAAGGTPPLRVAALRRASAGLIQTRLAGIKDSVLAATEAATRARLAGLGSDLVRACIVDHRVDAVAQALREHHEAGCDLHLVLGASAIADRRDVVPVALEAAGGAVIHFGMPVDPGNLLLLGRLGETPVLGLPGCARSPKLNGFDWVLWRLLAGIDVGPADIMRMGVGGLLSEIPLRPQPRERPPHAVQMAPRVAAVVLAAGRGSRMGGAHKLTLPIDGRPMVAASVDAALASAAEPVVVVLGHRADAIRAALPGRAVRFVDNPDYARGMSTSIQAGLAALPADVDGAILLLADMPRVTAPHIDRLLAAFAPADGRAICVPTRRGQRGNPVVFAARYFDALRALAGDGGGRKLLDLYADAVTEVEMADDAVLCDVDTPADLVPLCVAAPGT